MTDERAVAAVQQAEEALEPMIDLLRRLPDADLHRAHPDGGWTIAQIVSHVHLSGALWIALLQRLSHVEELACYREDLGHDVLGAPPPSSAEAADRIDSLLRALRDCLPDATGAVLDRTVEFTPFGRMPAGVLQQGIIGHLAGHAEQTRQILAARGLLPQDWPAAQPTFSSP